MAERALATAQLSGSPRHEGIAGIYVSFFNVWTGDFERAGLAAATPGEAIALLPSRTATTCRWRGAGRRGGGGAEPARPLDGGLRDRAGRVRRSRTSGTRPSSGPAGPTCSRPSTPRRPGRRPPGPELLRAHRRAVVGQLGPPGRGRHPPAPRRPGRRRRGLPGAAQQDLNPWSGSGPDHPRRVAARQGDASTATARLGEAVGLPRPGRCRLLGGGPRSSPPVSTAGGPPSTCVPRNVVPTAPGRPGVAPHAGGPRCPPGRRARRRARHGGRPDGHLQHPRRGGALAMLVAAWPGGVRAELIADRLWPHADGERAAHRCDNLLSSLRGRCPPPASAGPGPGVDRSPAGGI